MDNFYGDEQEFESEQRGYLSQQSSIQDSNFLLHEESKNNMAAPYDWHPQS